MSIKKKLFNRKIIQSTIVAFGMAFAVLHPGISTADGIANIILEGPNSANQRAFTNCSISYTMCIQRYGSRPGSNSGITRCADCLNRCNRSNGWWPMISGCSV